MKNHPEPIPKIPGRLSRDYLVPPFDVIHANRPGWQTRKKQWRSFGMVGEIGRTDKVHGLNWEKSDRMALYGRKTTANATSIFDPMLAEVLTLWFSSPGDLVYDPFAGGPPRGVVVSLLNREYVGIELRSPQVAANRENFKVIERNWLAKGGPSNYVPPVWICGDSTKAERFLDDTYRCDFVLTCPPYGDLEVYSDDPADLSTLPYPAFLELYGIALKHAADRLRDNRFLAIVVGEFRDKDGGMRNFVGDTATLLKKIGLIYYNEMSFLTAINTAPFRTHAFDVARKLVRVHQNVLIFLKGDNRKAAKRFAMPVTPIHNLSLFGSAEKAFF